MIQRCGSENDGLNYWPDAAAVEPILTVEYVSPRCSGARLISTIIRSHDKHFIVMSHSSHVTMKWGGRAATLPTLKGGRTHVRKARLLAGKMREN